MRVVWFTNTLFPKAAKEMGLPSIPGGSWMIAQLDALRYHFRDIEFIVLTPHRIRHRVNVDGIIHATFSNPQKILSESMTHVDFEKELQELVRDFAPDIIHVHGTESFHASINLHDLFHKPVLVSLQGILSALYPYYNGNISPEEIAPFRTLRNKVFKDGIFETQHKWVVQRVPQEKKAFSLYRHFAGRTSWDRALLAKFNPNANYYHIDEAMRQVFFNIRRDCNCIKEHSIYCSAAGSYPLKGLHWLLRATVILKRKYPKILIRIADAQRRLIPPRGPISWLKDADYSAYLRYLVNELDLKKNVVALPALSASDVANELKNAHVFCLPSLCENSPNSLSEAMLAGTPCIATDVGGIPSILEHGQEGLLCNSSDPIALADAIDQMFSNKALSCKFANNAKKKAAERHNPQKIAFETRKVYEIIKEISK